MLSQDQKGGGGAPPSRPAGVRAGALAGGLAGLATVGAMYAVDGLTGYRPLPEILQQPVLAAMPGPVFGFLIDTLQHLGKVLEEGGLILVLVAVLAGAAAAAEAPWFPRRPPRHRALAVAAGLWLVLVLAVLPLSGDGLLGLDEGIAVPLIDAVLLAVWAALVEAVLARSEPAFDPGRRRALGLVPAGIGLVGLALIAGRLIPGLASALRPPESALGGPSPPLTPVTDFYVVSKNFSDPSVDASSWNLSMSGLLDRPFGLGYHDLRALPATTAAVTLECISNNVGGDQISTGRFTGVPLQELVARARPRPGARTVAFDSRDGYTESLPLDYVTAHPEILVAYDLDGAPLPRRHGYPARVVVPGRYGMKGPKWLDRIRLIAGTGGGYWEGQGWDDRAVVRTNSRIDSPRDGSVVGLRPLTVAGVAFAGLRGIARVEVSTDGGRHWSPARLEAPVSRYTWTLWTYPWRPAREGAYTLTVRARDGQGGLQSGAGSPSFPAGASGYHTVRVDVSSR